MDNENVPRTAMCIRSFTLQWRHNGRDDVPITSLTIVYSTVNHHHALLDITTEIHAEFPRENERVLF